MVASCDGVSIRGCRFSGNSSVDGGAVQVWFPHAGAPADISDNEFEDNHASRRGGALVFDHMDWGIEDCNFVRNSADSLGGSIFVLDTTGFIRNCTFAADSVAAGSGGSVAINKTGGVAEADTFAVEGCTFNECYAARGGAIYLHEASEYRISGCQFTSTSADRGGGVFVDGDERTGPSSLPDTTFIENCLARVCSATEGGFLYIDDGLALLRESVIVGSTGKGAGVYWRKGGDPGRWSNLTFAFGDGNGAGVYLDGADGSIDLDVEKSVFAYNSVGLNQSLVAIGDSDSVTVSFSCCDSFGNVGGNGTPAVGDSCFVADPDFCWAEPDSGTFMLSAESPCLPGLHPNDKECGLIGARGQGCWVEEFTSCDGTWLDEGNPLAVHSTSDTLRIGAYADSAIAVVRFGSVDLPDTTTIFSARVDATPYRLVGQPTVDLRACLRSVVMNQANYQVFRIGSAWGLPGGAEEGVDFGAWSLGSGSGFVTLDPAVLGGGADLGRWVKSTVLPSDSGTLFVRPSNNKDLVIYNCDQIGLRVYSTHEPD